MRKLWLLLVVVLASGALAAAGCGDDDDDGGDGGGGASTEQKDSGGGSTEAGGDVKDNPQVKQAVENCKRTFEQAPQLSQNAKDKAKDVCDKAGSGDVDDAREAAEEVCTIVIEDTVPSGPAREQALDSCKQAAG